jgi:hypothetical protein
MRLKTSSKNAFSLNLNNNEEEEKEKELVNYFSC